ncbi:hypothetical protein ACHAPI_011128 [Fusarium lateritium]
MQNHNSLTTSGTLSPPADDSIESHPQSQKRPAAAAWDDNANANDRSNNKRRATRACLSCRNRKVRCDVINSGVPCTNCRLDCVDCLVTESNRGRRPTVSGPAVPVTIVVATTHPPEPEPEPPASQSPYYHAGPRRQPSPPSCAPATGPRPEPPIEGALSQPSQADDYMLSLSFEGQIQPDVHPVHGQSDPDHEPPTVLDSDVPSHSPSLNRPGNHAPRWPQFIRPLPRHITSADVEYLAAKDALTIPDDPFRDELLRVYATIVHPFMPSLNLHEFLADVLESRPNTVSMILFQAVMFASVVFVDIDYLKSRGFSSRKAARKVFFNRVRLLYGLECETNRQVLVQTLLMMTYWYDSPEDEKDTWYWMGIAHSHAQVLGLHRDPQQLHISPEEKRLRRRIWWSCLIRDRLLALGIRRPSRIRHDDFDVAMLAIQDFNLDQASDSLLRLLGESKLTLSNPAARATMAAMCVDLAKLCVCLGDILHSQYSMLGAQPTASSEHFFKVTVMPRRSEKQAQELVQYDNELSEWFQNQDSRSKYVPGAAQSPDGADRVMRLHQSQLYMNYLTTLGVLHRPQVFCAAPGPENAGTKRLSRQKVTEAAISMTKLALDLEASKQLRYLSTSSIPAFLSATLIHLVDIRSQEEDVRSLGIGRFYQCVHVLNQLQDMYSSADYAVRFLEMVLRKTDVKIPMLNLGRALKSRQDADDGCATSYPTPTDSRRNPFSITNDLSATQCITQADLNQSIFPSANIFEPWLMTNNSPFWADENRNSNDMAATSPLSDWPNNIDLLLPAMMDVNGNFGF